MQIVADPLGSVRCVGLCESGFLWCILHMLDEIGILGVWRPFNTWGCFFVILSSLHGLERPIVLLGEASAMYLLSVLLLYCDRSVM